MPRTHLRRRSARAVAVTGALLVGFSVLFGTAVCAGASPAPSTMTQRTVSYAAATDPVLPPGAPAPADTGATDSTAPAPGTGTTQQTTTPADEGGIDWTLIALVTGLTLLSLALFTVSVTTLSWMLHAWRSPDHLARTRFREDSSVPEPTMSFTLLVPGRHEEAVMGQTLDTLAASTHDRVQIIAIVGDDDPGTHEVAAAAARRHPGRVQVVVDDSVPKNKPKALNTALRYATGDIVGVFDAEDDVHPDLLLHVDARFRESGADVVQGGVQLMNVHTSWWTLRNCLEYYFWFRSRLHFHADQAFIPLGGNTVFTKRVLLEANDGWDPECLAEDCEIGVRLSSQGATVAVAYEPEVVTREETPDTIKALVKQRTRWNQGFLQVLGKGIWRQLPTRKQRWLARYTLSMPFLQAATGLLVPVSVVLIFTVKVPTAIVLLTLLPVAPTLMSIAMEMAAYGEFCTLYDTRRRARDYLYLVLGSIPYQLILAFAALRAVMRQLRGDGSWEKTSHANLHRTATTPDAPPAPELVGASDGSNR